MSKSMNAFRIPLGPASEPGLRTANKKKSSPLFTAAEFG